MQSDYRAHRLYRKARDLAAAWLRPASGLPATLGQITASPDGRYAAAAASICDALEGAPSTRIALVDLASGDLDILTKGPRSDSAPRWSPDGQSIAFLSDREQAHVNRLRIFDLAKRSDRAIPPLPGFVEYAAWSPDGRSILVGIAGCGSDVAGGLGAVKIDLESAAAERPDWGPSVEGSPEAAPWRSVWLYDLESDDMRRISPVGINIWEACWCGEGQIAAVCSARPDEDAWYIADVRLIDIEDGGNRTIYRPADQIGWLTASPSGTSVAVVEAVCSDRMIVAGDIRLIDTASGEVAQANTLGADVVNPHWRGDTLLLYAGAKGPETVVGLFDAESGTTKELWRTGLLTGAIFPEIAPLGPLPGDALFLTESFLMPPALVAIDCGGRRERLIRRFGVPKVDTAVAKLGSERDFSWTAPDGLEIHGWLLTPPGPGPHPLIMQVHGGPVWYMRPTYLGRTPFVQMALAAGYAVFQPNPRGSSGRGQAFAHHVFGDMGGADTQDYLSGLDALVEAGVADPERIGVSGGSYGGFMTSWLITQDTRFAAAVPVAPVTNWISEHLTATVPTLCELFLDDRMDNPSGKYFTRGPIFLADRVRTPTLNICGALDRITPAGQAREFHTALLRAGVESMLVTYPLEGHGVRQMPASFDYVARTLDWFQRHMPARPSARAALRRGGTSTRARPSTPTRESALAEDY